MFGQESEALERMRAQKQSQYAMDLRKQIEDQQKDYRNNIKAGANQILGVPPVRIADPQIERQNIPKNPVMNSSRSAPPRYQYNPNEMMPRQEQYVPSIEPSLQQFQYNIDRLLSVEIPSRIKPCEDSIDNMNGKLERHIASSRDNMLALRDKITEVTFTLNNLTQRMNDNNDKVREALLSYNQEQNRLRESIDSLNNKFSIMESKVSTIDETVKTMSQKQKSLERAVTEQLDSVSQTMGVITKSYESGDHHIMNQMEMLSRSTSATFLQVNQSLQSFSKSLSVLASDARNSFSLIRNELDDNLNNIQKQIDQNVTDTSQSFTILQEEVIQTISSITNHVELSSGVLEKTLTSEIVDRKENEKKIIDSNAALFGSLKQSIKTVDETMGDRIQQGCSRFITSMTSDFSHFMSESSANVQDCQIRVKNMEQRLSDYIISVGKRQDEVFELINKITTHQPQVAVEDILARIAKLESSHREMKQTSKNSYQNNQSDDHMEINENFQRFRVISEMPHKNKRFTVHNSKSLSIQNQSPNPSQETYVFVAEPEKKNIRGMVLETPQKRAPKRTHNNRKKDTQLPLDDLLDFGPAQSLAEIPLLFSESGSSQLNSIKTIV